MNFPTLISVAPRPMVPQDGFCQTAGCFAGHRVLLDGFTFNGETYARDYVLRNPRQPDTVVLSDSELFTEDYLYLGEGAVTVWDYAAKRFGLSSAEAQKLFFGDNDLSFLKATVDELCEDPNRTPEQKQALRETMDAVLAASVVGLWNQQRWIDVRYQVPLQ